MAVSRCSAHSQEAVALIRFLIAQELRSKAYPSHPQSAAEPQLYDLPHILEAYAPSAALNRQGSRLVSRPSTVTGHAYEDVTKAYIQAVHSVLTGQKRAPEAAVELERQLIQVTGFRPGRPERWK